MRNKVNLLEKSKVKWWKGWGKRFLETPIYLWNVTREVMLNVVTFHFWKHIIGEYCSSGFWVRGRNPLLSFKEIFFSHSFAWFRLRSSIQQNEIWKFCYILTAVIEGLPGFNCIRAVSLKYSPWTKGPGTFSPQVNLRRSLRIIGHHFGPKLTSFENSHWKFLITSLNRVWLQCLHLL